MSLFELFIGFRYLKSKKSQGFISFNTLLSMIIVFLGVFILIVVISVMNGFQSQIKDKILDVNAHISVRAYDGTAGSSSIGNYKELTEKISSIDGITSITPYVQGQGLFRAGDQITPVMLRGMGQPGPLVDDIKKFVYNEKKEGVEPETGPDEFGMGPEVLIGYEMAKKYFLKKGDYIELIVPQGRLSASMGLTPGIATFKIAGYFKTGYYEYDTSLIVMSLPQAQNLFAIGDRVYGLGIKVKDIYKMDRIAALIQARIGFSHQAITAEQENGNLFYALRLEKLIMTIILFLVILSAGFTIMGTLVMVVMEKRRAIGILKSMGAGQHSIMTIFVLEGFLIGLIGTLAGVVLGLATALNLEAIITGIETAINSVMEFVYATLSLGIYFPIKLVPSSVYYIDTIPTEISPEFVAFIAVFAVFLATLSAVFPAWHASRLKPVETIRYE